MHVPLGGALLMPLVAAILLATPREDRRTWAAACLLQGAILLGGLIAVAAGEDDGLAIQFLVDAEVIAAHETAAHWFLAAAAATLVAFGVGFAGREMVRRRRAAAAALLLGLLTAGLGARAGHLGGQLVFEHGAVEAHQQGSPPPGG